MKTPTRRLLAAATALSLGLGGALLVTSPAYAATITVTSGADSGAGTLREAIQTANTSPEADVIQFDAGVSLITVTSALPDIWRDLTIRGPGSELLTITGDTSINVGFWDTLTPDVTIAISGLTIDGFGTAIAVYNSTLSIDDVVGTNAQYSGLYLSNDVLTITDSDFSGNAGTGASISAVDSATVITNSSFSDNGMGGLSYSGEDVSTATLTDITATGNAGAASVTIHTVDSATVALTDSVVDDNLDNTGLTVDFSDDSVITMSGVTATGNNAFGLQGGSGQDGGGSLLITDSHFDSNVYGNITLNTNGGTVELIRVSADSSPGAQANVFISIDSALTISDSSFDNNVGGTGAGGAFVYSVSSGTVDITGTSFSHNSTPGSGGGLITLALDTVATLDDLTITDNTATGDGGGLVFVVDGTDAGLTLSNSLIARNESGGLGGGIRADAIGQGFVTLGALITNTTIEDNAALTGGGISSGNQNLNVASAEPALTISHSTISNNSAALVGGGLAVETDSGLGSSGDTAVIDSTVVGNSAGTFGGGLFAHSSNLADDVIVSNSTISANEAPEGSGIYAEASSLTLRLQNSVIANNDVDDLTLDDAALVVAYSLVERPAAALPAGTGNLTGVDPKLGSLANNGGTTRTMLPLAGSPLINAGNPAATGVPATDQRGLARVSGPRIDIGSVEVQQLLAATGTDSSQPLVGGALLAFAGILLLVVRRRRTA